MLSNAFKISLRTLYREKRYAAINIAGLSLAIACVVILGLYLRSELTYDQHYEGYENIYRLENEFNFNGVVSALAITPQMAGPLLSQDNPDIEEFVRFRPSNNEVMLTHENRGYFWKRVLFVSPNVFKVFKQRIVFGDPDTALDDPSSVAVSETFARTYFGNANPIGEVIKTDAGTEYRVSLVFADQPENTHLKYDVLFSGNSAVVAEPTNIAQQRRSFFGPNHFTYLKMRRGYNPNNWTASSQAFFDKNMKEINEPNGVGWRSWIQPLADVHLHSAVQYDEPIGNLYYIYAFSAVAIFILAVACINYMNLATARSAKRAREVGMRKILGSSRKALIVQFLSESILYSMIALACGLMLVELTFYFTNINDLLGKSLTLKLTQEPQLVLYAALFSLGTGVLAGLYPALYLSSWQPLTALVGNKNSGKTSATFRSALVFIQFTISVAVISCTILMAQQMRYVASKDLGFEKDNKLVIPLRGFNLIQQIEVMKTELLKSPRITAVTTSEKMLGGSVNTSGMTVEAMSGEMEEITARNLTVGTDFMEVMKLELIAGRSFGQRLLSDVGTNVVVNEAFVKRMGWGDQALGKKINDGRVVGVVKDFHFASLHQVIEPFVIRTFPEDYLANVSEANKSFMTRNLVVSISGDDVSDTISFLEEKMAGFDPGHPFEFFFLDETLGELYQSDENLMKLIGIFAGVCIFISCLGLYGLAAFTTEQRTREIGIRKVLGSSTSQIIAFLSRDVLALVLTGAFVASAVSWLAIDQWLASFAYRAGIDPLAFVVSSIAALVIAYGTIALQSYRTAQSDPAVSLRYE
jgi:putative ABC transport system permease protein